MTEGIILKGIGGFYYVDTPDGLIECRARGRFRKTVGKPIVGDRVTLEIQPEDGTGYLLDIAPRKNSLVRPAVANLDLLVAVASAAPPVTDPFLIDRVTAIAVHKGMEALVVINKTDENPGDELYEIYRRSGIGVLRVSALTGEGIDALKDRIRGRVSAFAGMWSCTRSRAAATSRTRRAFPRSTPSRWIWCWRRTCSMPSPSLSRISAGANSPAAPMSRKRAARCVPRSRRARLQRAGTRATSGCMKA